MKICPNCKATLDDNARFCLCCMTSLDEKEQILPPARQIRRWPLVLACVLLLVAAVVLAVVFLNKEKTEEREEPAQTQPETAPSVQPTTQPATQPEAEPTAPSETQPETQPEENDPSVCTQTIDGVCYTFRLATREDHPTAISLDNYYVLIRVEGTPADGKYRVPSFVNEDMRGLVTVIADGAFDETDARSIDLGHNVRYVWGDAFGGYPLTDLYLHTDVFIEETAFSGCTEALTLHGPDYLNNTEGALWSELAVSYGFRWLTEYI